MCVESEMRFLNFPRCEQHRQPDQEPLLLDDATADAQVGAQRGAGHCGTGGGRAARPGNASPSARVVCRCVCFAVEAHRRVLQRKQRLRTQLDEFTDDSAEVKSFSSGEDGGVQEAADSNKKRPGSPESNAASVEHAKRLRDALV